MSRWVDVAAIADLAAGVMVSATVEGTELLLARVGDSYFAADDKCPHMGARLSKGELDGNIVVCPRHGSRFDLRDGHVEQWTRFSGIALKAATSLKEPRPLRIYPVKIHNDRLLVDMNPGS